MPYKKLPVLEIDGKPVAQSNAVARYLARKYDLMGKDEWDAMICDELVDTLGDLKQVSWTKGLGNIGRTMNSVARAEAPSGPSMCHRSFQVHSFVEKTYVTLATSVCRTRVRWA
ncbi:hematopoietic prostaglandin D synthase-like [Bombus vancouverensis nearcticus]|uniref:hematopoietic prostaglandin D synthase-like n=1 Tax=Bombus vancouverensis nearcticus TaxID=2705178 RepID=UPI00402BD4A2